MGYKEVAIVEGNVCVDHVHLCFKIPPKTSVAEFMGYLKGKSALMIFDTHSEFKQKLGGQHFGERGYFVDTVGRNKEKIREYIRIQTEINKNADGLKQ